jgi:hypothetical protein
MNINGEQDTLHCQACSVQLEWAVKYFYSYLISVRNLQGARGSVVGCGTMLQAGRSPVRFSMRSLDFSFDLIFPAALWPWGLLSL